MAPLKKYSKRSAIAAVFLLFIFLSSCTELNQKQSKKVKEAASDSLLSTTETWNIDMKLIENGRKKVRLRGTYAASYETKKLKETRIKGPVSIQVFDSTATIKTWVHSDSAIYRAEKSEFEFFGDVRVRTRDNRHLESEYLNWEQDANKISTPRFVTITTPTDSIAGTGFRGTTDLSRYTIKKPSGQVVFD